MSTKHTPGPWIASRWTSKKNGEWIGEGWDILAQGNLLPRSSFDASPDAPDEPEANARLIAAAPHLLDRLRRSADRSIEGAAVLQQCFGACHANGLYQTAKAIEDVMALLMASAEANQAAAAKATGERP